MVKKLRVYLLVPIVLTIIISCKKVYNIPAGIVQYALLDSVNNLRAAGCTCGTFVMPPVKPLVWNSLLANAAESHAKDMSDRKYFSHITPEGTSPIQRAQQAGFTGNTVGENIAEGYTTTKAVMAAWRASEDHCMAMMDSTYMEMGAYSYNGYWVQEFGN